VHLSRQAINLNVDILENGQIQGKVRNAYTDNLGLNKRKEFHSHGTNDVETYLENKYQNLDITNFKVQNLENTKSPLIKTFDFSSKNSYHQSGGNIYLNPLFFFTEFKNPFKSESRKYPIDFTYPWSTTISVNINIPKNYSIEHIPETSGIALPDNIGMFSMSFLHQGDNIQVRYSFEMKRSILPPEDYLMLKDFYNQLIEKQTENI